MYRYYLIPMLEKDISFNGIPLKQILKRKQPILIDREEERIDILYSTSPLVRMPLSEEIRYKKHNEDTKKMYHRLGVPYCIIAYGNEYEAREILTDAKIVPEYKAALGIREITKEQAQEYYYINNYYNELTNFFNDLKIANETPFFDNHEFEGYIEGELDEIHIKGNFKGKIRIKKID